MKTHGSPSVLLTPTASENDRGVGVKNAKFLLNQKEPGQGNKGHIILNVCQVPCAELLILLVEQSNIYAKKLIDSSYARHLSGSPS